MKSSLSFQALEQVEAASEPLCHGDLLVFTARLNPFKHFILSFNASNDNVAVVIPSQDKSTMFTVSKCTLFLKTGNFKMPHIPEYTHINPCIIQK